MWRPSVEILPACSQVGVVHDLPTDVDRLLEAPVQSRGDRPHTNVERLKSRKRETTVDTDPVTTHGDTKDVVTAFLADLVGSGGLYLPVKNHAAPTVAWSFPKTTNENTLHNRNDVESWFAVRGRESEGKADSRFRDPPTITVERVVVEGNWAAVQFHAQGETLLGRTYDNRYALLMTVHDGKITEMREFFDTQHVVDTFGVDR
jgi:ketosteroid isomerase-like protein